MISYYVTRDPKRACDLRRSDPDFNHGKGKVFFRAFQRAIDRKDFSS